MARRSQRLRREKRNKLREERAQKETQAIQSPDNSIMIERLKEAQVQTEPLDLMKLLKVELLKMAEDLDCNVNNKNTKAQIIEAIQKKS